MCRPHWNMVPAELQRAVWRTYRPGQERDKRPTREYLEALRDAVRAVDDLENGIPVFAVPPQHWCGYCHEPETVRLVVEVDGLLPALCIPCWYAWCAGDVSLP